MKSAKWRKSEKIDVLNEKGITNLERRRMVISCY